MPRSKLVPYIEVLLAVIAWGESFIATKDPIKDIANIGEERNPSQIKNLLPEILNLLQENMSALSTLKIPIEKLLKLNRTDLMRALEKCEVICLECRKIL